MKKILIFILIFWCFFSCFTRCTKNDDENIENVYYNEDVQEILDASNKLIMDFGFISSDSKERRILLSDINKKSLS